MKNRNARFWRPFAISTILGIPMVVGFALTFQNMPPEPLNGKVRIYALDSGTPQLIAHADMINGKIAEVILIPTSCPLAPCVPTQRVIIPQ